MSEEKYKIPSPAGFPRVETGKRNEPKFRRAETNPRTIEIDSEWIIDETEVDEADEDEA